MSAHLDKTAYERGEMSEHFKPKVFFGLFALALLYWQAESYACYLPYRLTFLLIPGEQWGWTLKACGIIFSAVFFIHPLPFSLDTLLFQATMPSIEEELAYRGIMLALLERAFGHSPMSYRWRFGWAAVITSLLFWHDVTIHHGSLIIPLSRVDTAIDGAVWALARTRSGSLLWPMLFHSVCNLSLFAVAMMRYGGR